MSSGNLAPRASWEPPGFDFGLFWNPKRLPKRSTERPKISQDFPPKKAHQKNLAIMEREAR